MDSDYYSQSQTSSLPTTCNVQAGVIIKVHIKNFMCHDNLEVKLNPRINFLCGVNGSGKSAIQTAIAVGLGGKASATYRGSRIKALIQNDKNTCCITIILANEGVFAYKPQVYGSRIQVERSFSQTGQGGYRIKNAFGKLVSTEKKEIDRLVAHFNIQVENPVCILQQDVARNFLNSSDPKVLYKFYLKAAQLDEIAKLYEETSFRVHAVRDTVNTKFEIVSESFKDVLDMRKKLRTFEDAREKEILRERLENELMWAKVHESNNELQELKKRKEIEVLERSKIERKLKDTEENNLREKLSELEEKIISMDNLVQDAREKVRPAKDNAMRNKDQLANCLTKFSEVKQNTKLTKRKYDCCLQEIEKITKNAPEMKQRQEKLKLEIKDSELQLESLKAAENNCEHDNRQFRDTLENINKTLQSIKNVYNDTVRQKCKRENQVQLLSDNPNSLTVYGTVMVRIVEEINLAASQNKFKEKPIGPIGSHIKVLDSTWAGAIENFLGKGFLSSFCVDNGRDLAVLSAILKKVCSRDNASQPPIICSRFINQVHNIGPRETGKGQYKSLVKFLAIDNPVVINCLIDQLEIESVLLIPTNNEAYQLLDEAVKVPKNCKKAFTKTGDLFVPAPNYKSYSSSKPVTQATLLQAKYEGMIRQLNIEIKDLSAEVTNIVQQRNSAEEQLRSTSDSLKKNEMELRNLKRQKLAMQQKINELKSSIESDNQTNVGYLEVESQELCKQLEKETEKFKELKRECEEIKEAAEGAQKVYEEFKNTIAESDKAKAPILAEIQRLKSTIQQATSKADLMKHRIKEHEKKLEQIESEVTELTEQLCQSTENASQICEEVNSRKSTEEISRELKGVLQYLKKLEEENGGSLVTVQNNFVQRQEAFKVVNKDLNDLRELLKKTKHALDRRKLKETLVQQVRCNVAKLLFQSNLQDRHFDGKLEFNIDAGTLEIKVKSKYEIDRHDVITNSLSGGEKSVSTVCFIMALWDEVEFPFHFVDEIDICMDDINRRLSLDLLIKYAIKQESQQFVFLTPLQIPSIPADTDPNIITIHRLEAPREKYQKNN